MYYVYFLLTIFSIVIIGIIILYLFQEKFLFPAGKKLNNDFKFLSEFKFKEINISTSNKSNINALHFIIEDPKGVVLFFHGNRGNLSKWSSIITYFSKYNYNVFVIDYRGYGKSTGKFNEQQMYNDAQKVYEYLLKEYKESDIIVYGRSLGATFASHVAANNHPKHVVLEAPFYSIKHAAKKAFVLAPTFLLKYTFDNENLVKKITSPITFFHGDNDVTTSFEESKLLFKKVKSPNKMFITLKTGTHHNLKDFKEYKSELSRILH